jgi:hypothetical protein
MARKIWIGILGFAVGMFVVIGIGLVYSVAKGLEPPRTLGGLFVIAGAVYRSYRAMLDRIENRVGKVKRPHY